MINTTGNDPANLGRVALRQGTSSSSPTLTLDGIRVAESWANITAVRKNFSETPAIFSLSQNYPNPFNPSTNIDIYIPNSAFVTLKVYDILGREIAMLVNENLRTGAYTYTFDASNLPSGTYFYKLNAESSDGNSFTGTKIMTLVK
jgi:hypothetical protein